MRRFLAIAAVLFTVVAVGWGLYSAFLRPTRILVVNALKAQQADICLSNDSRHISVTCVDADQMQSLDGYDAVVFYARRIFLTPEQVEQVQKAAQRGVPVFTKTLRTSDFVQNHNLDNAQIDSLQLYFGNENRQNLRNALRFLRHVATPRRWGDQDYAQPVIMPKDMFYHRQYGQYFDSAQQLTDYLKKNNLYNDGGQVVALISGITFPMEGNREHVDTLISMLTQRGLNVYPMTCSGNKRRQMLQELDPDAIVFLSMGRIGNDTLVSWLQERNILLFSPFPYSVSHDEWMDESVPMSSGSKNARVVIPEIDGGRGPFCIGTQNVDASGYYVYGAEVERCVTFTDYVVNTLGLRKMPNSQKKVAIGYFRRPGTDALLASGMEVIPSMYNLLLRLRNEGYNVQGLPATLDEFSRQVKTEGIVLGSYAKGAQQKYLSQGKPVWIPRSTYEEWASQVIPDNKYAQVVSHYGPAPGELLARGDSIAVACLRYGNVMLFPQPRPALGDDDFKLVHGAKVPPPHSYLAPYLYMLKGFKADALIHFGTHGNLEFTPGRDAAMRPDDWSQQLVGSVPHFYYYTTGNIGEAIIAKRRSNAVLLTYLTPPYAESGMRRKFAALHDDIHKALAAGKPAEGLKRRVVAEGFHRVLSVDSTLTKPLTMEELERVDAHVEELMNEKMQGAYYTMGVPFSDSQLNSTVRAMNDDPAQWPRLRQLLLASTKAEIDNMVHALNGGCVAPAPGGDPVMNDNVLPTGRNMFSINPDNTPDPQAWEDGKRLAENTLRQYADKHGCYPRQVGYTFWAGEFIASGGATVAQALWMLGVEPVRDKQGRIGQLRLVPDDVLGRPRVNVVVQVSGQLRDIADSRLKLITEAVRMASQAQGDSNYVRMGTMDTEKKLIDQGVTPKRARELATLRVFGPVNGGYSTGMMDFIERSGKWDSTDQLVDGFINNMCAAYGDSANWGTSQRQLFQTAVGSTELLVQPRQSNTWGPLSLDHVYEFTGGMSMTVAKLSGKEPDALMADYRNPRNRKMQDVARAIDVEARTTLLNPEFVKERMKGDEGTAQMFGEMFRNVFGWNVTRPSSVDPELYDGLYRMYVADENGLGVRQYFSKVNPAAYQAMTAVMIESARKGLWKPAPGQLQATARLHAQITGESGAACTDFVCNNSKLQDFVARQLDAGSAKEYNRQMSLVKSGAGGKAKVLQKEQVTADAQQNSKGTTYVVVAVVLALFVLLAVLIRKRR